MKGRIEGELGIEVRGLWDVWPVKETLKPWAVLHHQ